MLTMAAISDDHVIVRARQQLSTTCEACGSKRTAPVMTRYTLSRSLVTGLAKLDRFDGPVKRIHLGLTGPEYSVFHKLAYWGLAKESEGSWEITQLGITFVAGVALVPLTVYAAGGVKVAQGDDLVRVADVLAGQAGKRVAA